MQTSTTIVVVLCAVLALGAAAPAFPPMMAPSSLLLSPADSGGLLNPVRAVIRGLARLVGGNERFRGFSPAPAPVPFDPDHTLANVLGYTATVTGMIPSLPQFYKNWKEKRGDAISMDLFVFRGAACLVNWIGSVMCREPLYNIIMNFYFCLETTLFIATSIYYNRNNKANSASAATISSIIVASALIFTPIIVYGVGGAVNNDRHGVENLVGTVCLWMSNMLFVWSRIPQMYMAHKTKSVHGVSLAMYILLIANNILSGSSILIQNIADKVPLSVMVVGSSAAIFFGTFGPVLLDLIYLYQYWLYSGKAAPYAVPDFGEYSRIEEIDDDLPVSDTNVKTEIQ